jgi:hypothetical protein
MALSTLAEPSLTDNRRSKVYNKAFEKGGNVSEIAVL